jgi:hypothetical protein
MLRDNPLLHGVPDCEVTAVQHKEQRFLVTSRGKVRHLAPADRARCSER